MKKRKIVGISQDKRFFNIDLRFSIPKSKISNEYVSDCIDRAHNLINGEGNMIYFATVTEDASGEKINIGGEYLYGVDESTSDSTQESTE
jgi:hypothetical protein